MSRSIAPGIVALLLCVSASPVVTAQQAVLFSEEPAGILDLAGQTRLVVERIPGKIYLRAGKGGELRYMARSLDQQREERPVALWLKGRSMILRPTEGHDAEPLLLEIAVSEEIAAALDLQGGELSVSGIQSSVEVRASQTEIDVRRLGEDLVLDLEGGRATVNGVLGALRLDGRDVEATLTSIEGPVAITVSDSRVELTEALSEIEIDADGGSVEATTVGRFDAHVRGAELRLVDSRIAAELRLESTDVHVAGSRGEVRVESDAGVTCEDLQGTLIVTGFGSNVHGARIKGAVEVVTDHAAVELHEIEGPARVQGTGLEIKAVKITGDVWADLSGSNLTLDQPGSGVEIKSEFGDVAVYNASGSVKIDSREGDVRVINLSGPLQLKAEGNRVDVSWAALVGEGSQSVENTRGDLHVSLPGDAEGRIELSAPQGRIHSSMSAVQVGDDASSASGSLGSRMWPLIRARSGEGDVHLSMAQSQPPPPAAKAKRGVLKLEKPDQ